ncbi:16S rRNA-processing protein RimM [Oleiphilus messinensis]|uniref:Ribosome maturation factor RimM n=1 Tax=Oleiphilus messinensis TaxID=141451 RepID=A0A1Y0I498_9GAMM|nr:ribosome maturation factor RimM [Oleiphilus messinensis]ARU55302.1 16S rRNA-processing protein RimM [Oleiphilus messinensis]
MKQSDANEYTVVGKITTAYGVKGWVKIFSFTDPIENILKYKHWVLQKPGIPGRSSNGQQNSCSVIKGKHHGKGVVALLEGCQNRDDALALQGAEIAVRKQELPELDAGEFYWHQLEGLAVVLEEGVKLGRVDHLIETGSNDVLIVKPTPDSMDDKERLIPYLPDQVIKSVNLESGLLTVDWDPEF